MKPHRGPRPRKKPRRLPMSRNAEIARRYAAGENPAAIAEALGTTTNIVRSRLHMMGVPRRDRTDAVKAANRIELDLAELVRLRRGGMSLPDLAERFGVHRHTVRSRLAELGALEPEVPVIPRPPVGPRRPARRPSMEWQYRDEWPTEWRDIARRHEAGESARGIARALGVGSDYVLRRLEAMGIERRDRKAACTAANLKPVDEAELVRLSAEGVHQRDIARRLGVSQTTVSVRLRALAAPAAAEAPDDLVIIERPADPADVAEVQAAEIPAAPPAAPPPSAEWSGSAHWKDADVDEAELARLYQAGLSCRDVGRRLGVSGDIVRFRLRRMGIELRPEGPTAAPCPAPAARTPPDGREG